MKKTIAMLSAAAMMAAMAVPFSAFAEDAVKVTPVGGTDTFDITPNPGTVNANVELGIDPAYTVTIPATFKLDQRATDNTYSGSGVLSAENVFLNEGSLITVSLTSASKFNLQTTEKKDYLLPYTATGSFGALTDKENGGKVAEFSTSAEIQEVTLELKTDKAPAFAGRYTDPVVFHIAITEAEQQQEPEPEPEPEPEEPGPETPEV